MKEQDKEVFNVDVQSVKPDGYRRGGFGLKRGVNHLKNVSIRALFLLRRDPFLMVQNVVPQVLGEAQHADQAAGTPQPATENAGALVLDKNDALTAKLAGLIGQLTPEQRTKTGLPDTKALAELAGHPVSAAERDAAHALYLHTAGA